MIDSALDALSRTARRDADKVISELEASLATLRLPPAPTRVRVALRTTRYTALFTPYVYLLGFFWLTWWGTKLTRMALGLDASRYPSRMRAALEHPAWNPWHSDLLTAVTVMSAIVAVPFLLSAVAAFTIGPLLLACGTLLNRPWGVAPVTRAYKRFHPVDVIAYGVQNCAAAYQAPRRHWPRQLRMLARSLRGTEVLVMRLHRSSGHLITRSHRRRPLKVHAGLVVSALRRAEARLDTDGKEALHDLASILMTIADRVAEGRIGALLDDTQLVGLQPVRDWEPFRLAAAASLFALASLGLSFLHLPDGANVYVIGGCGVVILTLLYGRRAYDFLGLLAAIRGG